MRKRLLKIYTRDFKTSANFVMETLTNFLSCYGKVIIHMSTWMDGIHLVKLHYQKKKRILQQPDKEFITKDDYKHAKRVCEDFGSQNLG